MDTLSNQMNPWTDKHDQKVKSKFQHSKNVRAFGKDSYQSIENNNNKGPC